MKFILIAITVLGAVTAQAHCPASIESEGTKYCYEMEWLSGDKKVKGQMQETSEMSPYLNKVGTLPNQWVYSKAALRIWNNGDINHVPVQLAELLVFPYMTMADGHHHPASANFAFNAEQGQYIIEGFSLTEMDGCWMLRSTQAGTVDLASSQLLANILAYSNLTEDENKALANSCSTVQEPAPGHGGDHGSGHHHH